MNTPTRGTTQTRLNLLQLKQHDFLTVRGARCDHENQYTIDVAADLLVATAKEIHKELRGTLTSVFCADRGDSFALYHVFTLRLTGVFILVRCHTKKDNAQFPAISPVVHAASWFEREVRDLFGIEMTGLLDDRPLALFPENWPAGSHPLRKDNAWNYRPPQVTAKLGYAFQRVEGEGVYEIPVGPVHAGVIEPGHFRFSVAGEPILRLEPRLFWKHKGIEKLFERRDPFSATALAERISGDEAYSFALAYMQSIEKICGISVDSRAEHLRGLFAELERISMHLFDIGNMCVGVAFNFGAAQLWRMKETLMREFQRITGDRFLRNVIVPSGVSCDISTETMQSLQKLLRTIVSETNSIVRIIESSSSILDRLKTTAPLRRDVATDFGAVGVVARGSGVQFDARINLPYSVYRVLQPKLSTETGGDVYCRTRVRIHELRESVRFACEILDKLPTVAASASASRALEIKDGSALGWAETPRGNTVFWTEIQDGVLSRVHVSTASFLNWHCMPEAVQGMIVPDFPLLNKSFGLSYSGCDR